MGKNGCMGCREGEVEKERPILVLPDHLQGLVCEMVQDLFMHKIVGSQALPPKALACSFCSFGGNSGEPVVLDVYVGWHVQRPADPIIGVEPHTGRPALDGLGIVDRMAVAELSCFNKTILFGKVHAQVPLAYCMGGVSALLKKLGDGFPVLINQGGREASQHIAFQL
jgi:hypothetical protein